MLYPNLNEKAVLQCASVDSNANESNENAVNNFFGKNFSLGFASAVPVFGRLRGAFVNPDFPAKTRANVR